MRQPGVVVITGMHRSGTSLVASLLRHAGVDLGPNLIGPDEGNRYGYFEDVDFNTFHGDILTGFEQSHLVQDAEALAEKPEEKERARELVEQRSTRNLWGFKDPRTCLFLDFWHGLLPQAAYVFVYRHPLEVVLSLLRRGKQFDLEALANPLTALRSWETHNRLLLNFYREHADHCFLGHISAISADTERFVHRVSKKLAVPLRAEGTQTLYHATALNQMIYSADTISVLNQIAPEAMKLYDRLDHRADLPSPTETKVARRPVSHSPKPKAAASELAHDDGPQVDRVSHLFSAMLTAVAPQEMLAGKEALDGIRKKRIRTLETEAASREQLVAAQKEQRGRAGDHARNLERRLVAHEERLAGLTAHAEHLKELAAIQQEQLHAASAQAQKLSDVIAGQEEQLRRVTTDTTELRRMLAGKDAGVQEQTARVGELKKLLASTAEQLQERIASAAQLEKILASREEHLERSTAQVGNLEQLLANEQVHTLTIQNKLDAIEGSRVWRLAKKWYAFKYSLGIKPKLPPAAVTAVQVPDDALAPSPPPAETRPPVETPATDHHKQRPVSHTGSAETPTVLFISHDAHRTGAPLLLLCLLKWLKNNTNVPFEVLLRQDGALRREFEALAPVTVWPGSGSSPFEKRNVGLIYSNTITNGKVLQALSSRRCPTISHIHELEYWISYRTERENTKQIKKHTDLFIAASQAVKRNLVQNLGIPARQVEVVYEFIDTQSHMGPSEQRRVADRIRKRLEIPQDALVIGAAGTTDWRKGSDLFIHLARSVRQRALNKPVHFVWIGGATAGPKFGALWHDVKRVGLESYVHFLEAQADPRQTFATFDVFTLMSREDPFPLVNLEAALLGKPVLCFDQSGGSPEFVEDDCGFVIPYLDFETMADRAVELLRTPELRKRMGTRAAAKVRERHDVAIVAPKILSIIQRFCDVGSDAQEASTRNQPPLSEPTPLPAKPDESEYLHLKR